VEATYQGTNAQQEIEEHDCVEIPVGVAQSYRVDSLERKTGKHHD